MRETSLGLKRKYRVSADDGNGKPGKPLRCAEKRLKMPDDLGVHAARPRQAHRDRAQRRDGARTAAADALRHGRRDHRGLVKYHFDFARDGEPVFSIDKPRVFDDWYPLTVHEAAVDRQLLFALR